MDVHISLQILHILMECVDGAKKWGWPYYSWLIRVRPWMKDTRGRQAPSTGKDWRFMGHGAWLVTLMLSCCHQPVITVEGDASARLGTWKGRKSQLGNSVRSAGACTGSKGPYGPLTVLFYSQRGAEPFAHFTFPGPVTSASSNIDPKVD